MWLSFPVNHEKSFLIHFSWFKRFLCFLIIEIYSKPDNALRCFIAIYCSSFSAKNPIRKDKVFTFFFSTFKTMMMKALFSVLFILMNQIASRKLLTKLSYAQDKIYRFIIHVFIEVELCESAREKHLPHYDKKKNISRNDCKCNRVIAKCNFLIVNKTFWLQIKNQFQGFWNQR